MDDVGLDALVGELPKELPECTLIEDLGMLYPTESSKQKRRFGIYECGFCGAHFKTQIFKVKCGHTKSCGCYNLSQKTTHNYSGTKLYNNWMCIKDRTLNTFSRDYPNYGGRGIYICSEWADDFVKFREWCLSNGYKEDSGLSIDRIDNDKGYSPDNCRWVTKSIQQRNQRIPITNTSGFKGVSFYKKFNNYVAQIGINGGTKYLGTFRTVIEAGITYNNYIVENNLEGFVLNIIPEEFKDVVPQRLTRKKKKEKNEKKKINVS